MNFLLSDTFSTSLARLTNEEQKAVKLAAFDLQANPAQPGLKLHKLDRTKDKRFHSVYVNRDIRLILHKTESSLLLCYVDHHDKAYQWAERRKLETHPSTGAAQLVEIRETVKEIEIPRYVEVEQPAAPKPLLFANVPEEELLRYGVPEEWLADVLVATDDTVLELAGHLPHEAAEALLQLATGQKPLVPAPVAAGVDPFEHPEAQRRFRVMTNVDELQQALDYPWDKWTIFLHPAQRDLVEKDFSGPARVSGTAGTGKTIVALHRAVYLAKSHAGARVLLTTFSQTLASALRGKLRRLISTSPRLGERIDVEALDDVGLRLYKANIGPAMLASDIDVQEVIRTASAEVPDHKFSHYFLLTEWREIVDAWQLKSWEEYRDVARLGRKVRLPEKQRQILWDIFQRGQAELTNRKMITQAEMFTALAVAMEKEDVHPYNHVVVDEAQDISVAQLKFLSALGGREENSLFFAGDLGQRIFQVPYSWKSVGVDIRGRSKTLKINYRTSHQIRRQADLLLDPEVADVDGNVEDRRGAVSVFNGSAPEVSVYESSDEEAKAVAKWIEARLSEGVMPHEIGIFVRSDHELLRAQAAAKEAGLAFKTLDQKMETISAYASIATMHLAKGLEFRAVVVMACDDEVLPSAERVETVTDDSDLQEVYNTERHLLYVACTRARDFLLVTGVRPGSEFLDDLRGASHL